jgi:uncharacterized protein
VSDVPKLTAAIVRRLRAFLDAPERPKGTMRYEELAGFLFAVVSCPELIMPSEWMPEIYRGKEAGFRDLAETQSILPMIMALYNRVAAGRSPGSPRLTIRVAPRTPPSSNLEPDAPLSLWSRGFAYGHGWVEESWEAIAETPFDEDLGAALLVLTFFAKRGVAEAFTRESTRQPRPTVEEMAAMALSSIPDAMRTYSRMGMLVEKAIRETERRLSEDAKTPSSTGVGRNDPCPCGSGKKLKKCCGSVN